MCCLGVYAQHKCGKEQKYHVHSMHSVSLVHLWKPTFDFLSVLEHGSSHLAAYTGANSSDYQSLQPSGS